MGKRNKYILYIDILGFSQMVKKNSSIVDDLYNVIASLNVHSHHSFKTIIFSDTILVYNMDESKSDHDRRYLVMYLCEFVQDLQYRLVGRNIFFRAIIKYGEFIHYEINQVPCFYGRALIDTYTMEKEIQCTGLFINNDCNKYNNIFKTAKFNENLSFVYLTQGLEQLEYFFGGSML